MHPAASSSSKIPRYCGIVRRFSSMNCDHMI
nr:MAG TPA: hypothetical protein [Caudoviricetes sp.]